MDRLKLSNYKLLIHWLEILRVLIQTVNKIKNNVKTM